MAAGPAPSSSVRRTAASGPGRAEAQRRTLPSGHGEHDPALLEPAVDMRRGCGRPPDGEAREQPRRRREAPVGVNEMLPAAGHGRLILRSAWPWQAGYRAEIDPRFGHAGPAQALAREAVAGIGDLHRRLAAVARDPATGMTDQWRKWRRPGPRGSRGARRDRPCWPATGGSRRRGRRAMRHGARWMCLVVAPAHPPLPRLHRLGRREDRSRPSDGGRGRRRWRAR